MSSSNREHEDVKKSEAEMILQFIKHLETRAIEVSSRYGDHEETKKYLREKEKV